MFDINCQSYVYLSETLILKYLQNTLKCLLKSRLHLNKHIVNNT